MSSAPPSRVLVNHKYAEDRHLPSLGEIIVVRLSQDLFGPGSTLISSRNLPSRATKHNYHHAVVLDLGTRELAGVLTFTVLPMPAYSATDPTSGLSSTSWLLSQPVDFQQQHIPVPDESSPSLTQPQPPFLTPAGFGDSLQVGGWKDSKPRWVLAVPQVTEFQCFGPPVKLNEDEVRRLRAYSRLFPSPVVPSSNTMSSFPPGSSLAFQALYANEAVKRAFANLTEPSIILDSDSDSDDEDDDWEDRMDPVTFARYYAHSNAHLAKIVQEHDQKMRARLHQDITNWAEGVQAGDAS